MSLDVPLAQGDLLPSRFNQLLNGPLSTRISYLRALLCPCRGVPGGGPDPRCPACSGLGYLWTDPVGLTSRSVTLTRAPLPGYERDERLPAGVTVTAVEDERGQTYPVEALTVRPDGSVLWDEPRPDDYTRYTVTYGSGELRAAVQGVMSRREYQTRGEYEVLDLEMTLDRYRQDQVTPNPAWDCGENDRFILLDQWRRHAQHVMRQDGKGDRVLHRHMRGMTVATLDGADLVTYESVTDYLFQDGRFVWQPGRGPKQGTYYTVQGEVNPEYYVFQALPQTRQADGHMLPRRIVLKGFERFPNRRPEQAVGPKQVTK